jgi:hypothetical protein
MVDWPFIGTEAVAAGAVNRYQLRTRYTAVYRNVYVEAGQDLTPVTKAVAAWLWSRREATVAGVSAAALLGSRWIDAAMPAEINRRSRERPPGIVVFSDRLSDGEKSSVAGVPVTTPARTALDIGRRNNLTTAVIRLDALMRATEIDVADVLVVAARHRGARGVARLRRALALVDPGAESPQETRTRLALVRSGLPAPSTQIEVHDAFGRFVARLDMGWDDWKVAVEFDGAQHWTDPAQRTRDIDRLAELEALGWKVIRVSSDMLWYRPGVMVARVRAALQAAGCPWAARTSTYERQAA